MCPSSSAVPVLSARGRGRGRGCVCVSVVCASEGAFIYGSALAGETAASLSVAKNIKNRFYYSRQAGPSI